MGPAGGSCIIYKLKEMAKKKQEDEKKEEEPPAPVNVGDLVEDDDEF